MREAAIRWSWQGVASGFVLLSAQQGHLGRKTYLNTQLLAYFSVTFVPRLGKKNNWRGLFESLLHFTAKDDEIDYDFGQEVGLMVSETASQLV